MILRHQMIGSVDTRSVDDRPRSEEEVQAPVLFGNLGASPTAEPLPPPSQNVLTSVCEAGEPSSAMASATKAAEKVPLLEALGIKSPSKKSAKKAVATNDDLPDGAAGDAGDHGVAGGVVPQRPEQMVPTESLIKARRLIFSKDFPSTAPTKTSKQELWEVISVLRIFSQEGQPLTEIDPPKATPTQEQAEESGEAAPGTGADAGALPVPTAPSAAPATPATSALQPTPAPAASASLVTPAAVAAATGAPASGSDSDSGDSGDWNVVPGKPCVMRPRYCRSWLAGAGCSRPEKCKFLHTPFCKRKSCKNGKTDSCPNFHRLSRHVNAQKSENGAAGPSNRAKTSPPVPNNKKPPSVAKMPTNQLSDRMSEVERNIARLDGISWALAASPKPLPVPTAASATPVTSALQAIPTPPTSASLVAPVVPVPAPLPAQLLTQQAPASPPPTPTIAVSPRPLQNELVLQMVSGMANLINNLQAALTADLGPATSV